jgi:hypothetical protein
MLIKLAKLTKSDPDPPTWEYILFDDHPTFASEWCSPRHGRSTRVEPR